MVSPADIGPCLRTKKNLSPKLASLRFVETNGSYNFYGQGAFGLVYRAYDGNRQVAVKFYHKKDANREARYTRLNEFLRKNPIPEFKPSEYVSEALELEDDFEYIDALVVDLVEEQSLTAVIKECMQRRDSTALNQIGNQLMGVSTRLSAMNVVHGDIHPDNIFVKRDKSIILIDYDDVWVKGALEIPPKTAGLPGFQHPKRQTAQDIGPWLDNFSFGIIYIQIQILLQSINSPAEYNSAQSLPLDQKIIFDELDYSSPQKSEIFKKYALHNNPQIRSWMAVLINDFLAVTHLHQIPKPTIQDLTTRFRSYLDPKWNAPPAAHRIYNPQNLADARFFLNKAMMAP